MCQKVCQNLVCILFQIRCLCGCKLRLSFCLYYVQPIFEQLYEIGDFAEERARTDIKEFLELLNVGASDYDEIYIVSNLSLDKQYTEVKEWVKTAFDSRIDEVIRFDSKGIQHIEKTKIAQQQMIEISDKDLLKVGL